QVGRGVLEALGVGLSPGQDDLCARANFCTLDSADRVVSRRAVVDGKRLATEECAQLCAKLAQSIGQIEDIKVTLRPGKEHRFVAVFSGPGLAAELTESDPGHEGTRLEPVKPLSGRATKAARVVNEFVRLCRAVLAGRDYANSVLLRGWALPPRIPTLRERFKLTAACVAAYPMYRGLARLVGMEVLECGDTWDDEVEQVHVHRDKYDFFFVHLKELDKAGEDGDFDRKVELLERFDDDILPRLLGLHMDVLCITGDHSTPAVMGGHSWHSVPFLLHSRYVRPQIQVEQFAERACARGSMGRFAAKDLMALLLAHSLKLAKFGA
ncbi:MAG: phosphoglycerate mutase, partial [candidate division WOR-3 bacterium]